MPLAMVACGGSGGGTLHVTPSSLDLLSVQSDAVAAPTTLHVTYEGDGLYVGYPPGVDVPNWLSVSALQSGPGFADISVGLADVGLSPGLYSTTLRFVAGKADGTAIASFDVPVRVRSALGPQATPASLSFHAVEGAALPASQTLQLTSDLAPFSWSLAVDYNPGQPTGWLQLSSAQGAGQAQIQVSTATMPAGTYTAVVVIIDGGGVRRLSSFVEYVVEPVIGLAEPVRFELNQTSTQAALEQVATLVSTLPPGFDPGLTWEAVDLPAWLSVTPSSGPVVASTALVARVDPARLAAQATGQIAGTLRFRVSSANYSPGVGAVTVDLAFPRIDEVTPSYAWQNRGTPLTLVGVGFSQAGTLPIRFGSTVVVGTVVSDTEVQVAAPPLSGSVALAVDNPVGVAVPGPTLRVMPIPNYGPADIALPAGWVLTMTLDRDRQAVLLARPGAGDVLRLRWRDGNWTTDSVAAARASGVAVSRDRQKLIVSTMSLDYSAPFLEFGAETLELQQTVPFSTWSSLDDYNLIAVLEDGSVRVVNSNQWSYAKSYPDFTGMGMVGTLNTRMIQTRDQRRTLFAGDQFDHSLRTLDGVGVDYVGRTAPALSSSAQWSVDETGARLVMGTTVLARDFSVLGSLDVLEASTEAVAVHPSGSAVYVLGRVRLGSPWVLRRFDISADVGPYVADPDPLPLLLPTSASPVAMTVSDDGGALFLVTSGEATGCGFHVIPLP